MSLSQRETEKRFGRPKQIIVWENGDFYSDGHVVLINPSHHRTWNGVLSMLTETLKPSVGAIRHLLHLNSKEFVTSFEQLQQNEKYIATGNEKLKEAKNAYKTPTEKTYLYSHQNRKFYLEQTPSIAGCVPRGLKTVLFVMANGKTEEMPCKVVLTESDIESWETVKEYIARTLDIPEGIQYLYTIFGDMIDNPRYIQNGCIYVAVPVNDKFISIDYPKVFSTLLPMREINMERSRNNNSDTPPSPRHCPSTTKQGTDVMKSKCIKQTQANQTSFQSTNSDKPIAAKTLRHNATLSKDLENAYVIQTTPTITKMYTNCAYIGIGTKKTGDPRTRPKRRYCCSNISPSSKTNVDTEQSAINKSKIPTPNIDDDSVDLTLDAIENVKSDTIRRKSVETSSATETQKSDMEVQADIVTKTDQDTNLIELDLKETKPNTNSDVEVQAELKTGSVIEKHTNTQKPIPSGSSNSTQAATEDISLKLNPERNLLRNEINDANGVDIFKELEDLDLESRRSNKISVKSEPDVKKKNYFKSNSRTSVIKSITHDTGSINNVAANTKKTERHVGVKLTVSKPDTSKERCHSSLSNSGCGTSLTSWHKNKMKTLKETENKSPVMNSQAHIKRNSDLQASTPSISELNQKLTSFKSQKSSENPNPTYNSKNYQSFSSQAVKRTNTLPPGKLSDTIAGESGNSEISTIKREASKTKRSSSESELTQQSSSNTCCSESCSSSHSLNSSKVASSGKLPVKAEPSFRRGISNLEAGEKSNTGTHIKPSSSSKPFNQPSVDTPNINEHEPVFCNNLCSNCCNKSVSNHTSVNTRNIPKRNSQEARAESEVFSPNIKPELDRFAQDSPKDLKQSSRSLISSSKSKSRESWLESTRSSVSIRSNPSRSRKQGDLGIPTSFEKTKINPSKHFIPEHESVQSNDPKTSGQEEINSPILSKDSLNVAESSLQDLKDNSTDLTPGHESLQSNRPKSNKQEEIYSPSGKLCKSIASNKSGNDEISSNKTIERETSKTKRSTSESKTSKSELTLEAVKKSNTYASSNKTPIKPSSASKPFNKISVDTPKKYKNINEHVPLFCNNLCSICCNKSVPNHTSVNVRNIPKRNSQEARTESEVFSPNLKPEIDRFAQDSPKDLKQSSRSLRSSSKSNSQESWIKRSPVSILSNASRSRKHSDLGIPTSFEKTKINPSKQFIPEHESVQYNFPKTNGQEDINLPLLPKDSLNAVESSLQDLKDNSKDLTPGHESLQSNRPKSNKQEEIYSPSGKLCKSIASNKSGNDEISSNKTIERETSKTKRSTSESKTSKSELTLEAVKKSNTYASSNKTPIKASSASKPFNKISVDTPKKYKNINEHVLLFCNNLCSICCNKSVPNHTSVNVRNIPKRNSQEARAESEVFSPNLKPELDRFAQDSPKDLKQSSRSLRSSSKSNSRESWIKRSSVSILSNASRSRKHSDLGIPTSFEKTKINPSKQFIPEHESVQSNAPKTSTQEDINLPLLPKDSLNAVESSLQDLKEDSKDMIPEHESVQSNAPKLNEQEVMNLPSSPNDDLKVTESSLQDLKEDSDNLMSEHESVQSNTPKSNEQEVNNLPSLSKEALSITESSLQDLKKDSKDLIPEHESVQSNVPKLNEQEVNNLPSLSKEALSITESSLQDLKKDSKDLISEHESVQSKTPKSNEQEEINLSLSPNDDLKVTESSLQDSKKDSKDLISEHESVQSKTPKSNEEEVMNLPSSPNDDLKVTESSLQDLKMDSKDLISEHESVQSKTAKSNEQEEINLPSSPNDDLKVTESYVLCVKKESKDLMPEHEPKMNSYVQHCNSDCRYCCKTPIVSTTVEASEITDEYNKEDSKNNSFHLKEENIHIVENIYHPGYIAETKGSNTYRKNACLGQFLKTGINSIRKNSNHLMVF